MRGEDEGSSRCLNQAVRTAIRKRRREQPGPRPKNSTVRCCWHPDNTPVAAVDCWRFGSRNPAKTTLRTI